MADRALRYLRLHTPNSGRQIIVAADKIESLVEVVEDVVERRRPALGALLDGEGRTVQSTRRITQVNMDSGDQGRCRESVDEILAALGELGT